MKQPLKTAMVLIGVAASVLIAPWIILYFMFEAEDAAKERAQREYVPVTLADAVCMKYATPEKVAHLLEHGEDIHQQVLDQQQRPTPLIDYAASCGHLDVVSWLIGRGARVSDVDLRNVLLNRFDETAEFLVKAGARLDTTNAPRQRPEVGTDLLQAAAYAGQAWIIPLLIKQGHDAQIVTAEGEGLLALALMDEYHDNTPAVKALLAVGAHVDPLTDAEDPPLYWAAYFNRSDAVDLLLAAGANANVPASRRWMMANTPAAARETALSKAVQYCRLEIAAALLQRGASKNTVLDDGKSLSDGGCEPDRREKMRALLAR
jgi:ankyrin repeat protein